MTLNLGTTWPVARDRHRCESCGKWIHPGEKYQRSRIVDCGEAWVWKSHLDCYSASKILWDDGREVDGMLISVMDMEDDDMDLVWAKDPALAARIWPSHGADEDDE